MNAHQHFGLHTPPFDAQPDQCCFYRSETHVEALAMLDFTVHTAKACAVLLGEAGAGKTLLGRLLAKSVCRRHGVLWIPGIGQPRDLTNATFYPPTRASEAPAGQTLCEASLTEWIRSQRPGPRATVLIVDNADGLHQRVWDDILAIVTREPHPPRPTCVILLGLPSLMSTLAQPGLLRLRRRIFRTFHLARFTRDGVAEYIRHRIQTAGGATDADFFTPSAVELIRRFSGGNPAVINQICDNALLDAFGDGREQIDETHIVASANALAGVLIAQPDAADPLPALDYEQIAPTLAGEHDLEPQPMLTPPTDVQSYALPEVPLLECIAQPTDNACTALEHDIAQPPPNVVSIVASSVLLDADPHALNRRLLALDDRLTDAIERVGVVCTAAAQCETDTMQPADEQPADDHTDDPPPTADDDAN